MSVPQKLIAIGASAGGSHALVELLRHLPSTYPLPILVVKHHSSTEDTRDGRSLVKWLDRRLDLQVSLAEDKDKPMPGTVTVAPPNYHLLVNHDGSLGFSQDEPVIHARPSIDVLFESVADSCGASAIGIVLTGASQDGAAGAEAIRRAGGRVFVQNPETAEVPIMPRAALADKYQDESVELDDLATQMLNLAREEHQG